MPRPEFTLHDLLHNSVERDPQKAAVVDGDAEYSYEDLERESSALAAALVDAAWPGATGSACSSRSPGRP
jgi:non-ribosomal peptide synthetase component E (peptide arylation enzyme)